MESVQTEYSGPWQEHPGLGVGTTSVFLTVLLDIYSCQKCYEPTVSHTITVTSQFQNLPSVTSFRHGSLKIRIWGCFSFQNNLQDTDYTPDFTCPHQVEHLWNELVKPITKTTFHIEKPLLGRYLVWSMSQDPKSKCTCVTSDKEHENIPTLS